MVEISTDGHCFLVSISELIVPVRLEGGVGAVFIVENRGGAFSEDDLEVIRSLVMRLIILLVVYGALNAHKHPGGKETEETLIKLLSC